MTEYVVLLPGNEGTREINGGNELQNSRTAKTVRRSGDSVQITAGPHASGGAW